MATPEVQASIALYEAAEQLRAKGHCARAAEKHGLAAAAAAQELAAEDCLVVAFLQAAQAEALCHHGLAPNQHITDAIEAWLTVDSVLLPHCVPTLIRRKTAGTLLYGCCRATEVAWWHLITERMHLRDGEPAEVARACAEACSSPTFGFEAYMLAARVGLDVLGLLAPSKLIPRELQLSRATFVASGLKLMARVRKLPVVVVDGVCKGVLPSSNEQVLARRTRVTLRTALVCSKLGEEVVTLIDGAWRRVERSGAVAMHMLGAEPDPTNCIGVTLAAAAAEAAERGTRECALAGCAAKEVHVSQFKRCGACRAVFYCCREHQVADWPAHKAACKEARKAAEKS
jgi:hypothetical protein